MTAMKRMFRDYGLIQSDSQLTELYRVKQEEGALKWSVLFQGPPASPFKGMALAASLEFPTDFPFKPPVFKMLTPILHPNTDTNGSMCVALLREKEWKPVTTAGEVLGAIYGLLETPNLDDPLRAELADMIREDPKKYERLAKEDVKKNAKPWA